MSHGCMYHSRLKSYFLLLALLPGIASAAVVFSDNFEVGSAFTTGAGSQTIVNGWWSSGPQSKAYNSVNNVGSNFTGRLGWAQIVSESNFDSLATSFNPVSLTHIGDAITLSFHYTTTSTVDASVGLRVRLYAEGAGLLGSGANGYGLHIPSGTTASPLVYQSIMGVNPFNSGSGEGTAVAGGTEYGNGDATVEFTVTKTGTNTVTLSGSHGVHTFNAVESSTHLTMFNALGISAGSLAMGVEIDDVLVTASFVDTNDLYIVWVAGFGLLESDADKTADPDGDGIENFLEYALGGNPTTNDAANIRPSYAIRNAGGTNRLDYIYNRRTDNSHLIYLVEAATNLVSGKWCALGVFEDGLGVVSNNLESVTNRFLVGAAKEQFLRLQISEDTDAVEIGFDTPHEWYCDYQSPFLEMIPVSNVAEVMTAVEAVAPGQSIVLADGVYSNLSFVIRQSGAPGMPVVVRAEHPGQVVISGDSFIEIDADYVVLAGLYFKDGARNPAEWGTHAEGLITIYGSHNRITDCAIHQFDEAHSGWIVSLLKDGITVPQYNRIDHCSFTEKITFDQVINLNNIVKQTTGDPHTLSAPPIYSRIDHCYFSNPPKPGNAGGAIRIGYYRGGLGRCIVDSNVFERQDSEPEIITSKSQENLYYNNTYKNCRGTMNFRHGDHQVLVGSYLYSTDTMHEYGGAFLWGSGHVVANNYFSFARTLGSRGNAALYLNAGIDESEHATCFSNVFARNIFVDNSGYDVDCEGLLDRRITWAADRGETVSVTRGNRWLNNVFQRDPAFSSYQVFRRVLSNATNDTFSGNIATNANQVLPAGFSFQDPMLVENAFGIKLPQDPSLTSLPPGQVVLENMVGVDVDINELVNRELTGMPLGFDQVGPSWLVEKPGTYAETGVLTTEVQARLDAITQ